MYGGAIAISSVLNSTGAGLWFAQKYIVPHMASPWSMVMILSVLTMIMTEAMSNAAVVAILLPIGMSAAVQLQLDPKVAVYTIASASGMAYALPMSTPAVAIAYSSGYLKLKDVVAPALIMVAVSWLVLMLSAKFWWPVIGIWTGR
jgi:solute carrier family 13 (sodium-dependent dicarboxylate transporter), member 2/3/5